MSGEPIARPWRYEGCFGCGRENAHGLRLDFVRDGQVNYDRMCLMNLRTENGLRGRCVQDVVTNPARKWARIQGETGAIEWGCGREEGTDAVTATLGDGTTVDEKVRKTRPQDFISELTHIADALVGDASASPISLARGLDTMLVVAAAHRSAETGRAVGIDYSKGYRPSAILAE